MGEYAKYQGKEIKIGTCEDMLYLRFDQRLDVQPVKNSLNPNDPTTIREIRFRFPFPQEDRLRPGEFTDPFYSLGVYGASELLKDVDHGSVQFCSNYPHKGILLSIPCPLHKERPCCSLHQPLNVSFNGYAGDVRIVQQKLVGEELWTVCECGACGAKFRLPLKDAEILAVALRSHADKQPSQEPFYHTIADRILCGYKTKVATSQPQLES